MPPKETQGGRGGGRGGGGGRGRGEGRGGGGGGGGPGPRGGGRGGAGGGGGGARGGASASAARTGPQAPAAHTQTVGVRRPGYGTAGRAVNIKTNLFELKLDCPIIHHYDAVVPDTKVLPTRLMNEIYRTLKAQHPQIFGAAAYDGRKNLYSATHFPFEGDTQEYQITLSAAPAAGPVAGPAAGSGREPKLWRVRLTKTHQTINPLVLQRYVQGQQSHDNDVIVAINALNVAAAMLPGENPNFTAYGRSILIPEGSQDIGSGLSLWRGYFQSVRPTIGKMVVNVDITTALMHKPGPVMDVALEFLGKTGRYQALNAGTLSDPERRSLQKFLFRLRITTTHNPSAAGKSRGIQGILATPASSTRFTKDGQTQTVQHYYEATYRKKLKYPQAVLVEIGPEVWLPMEVCVIMPGQPRRQQPPPELTKAMVEFATKKPQERLADIKRGLTRLGYGQSPYLRAFGAEVGTQELVVPARVLNPPKLEYAGKKTLTVLPGAGTWNQGPNKFYASSAVKGWGILVFARQEVWKDRVAQVRDAFVKACVSAGITGITSQNALLDYGNPMRDASESLRNLAMKAKPNPPPSLVLIILPANSSGLYSQIKHFGDVKNCVATQCVLESKLFKRSREGGFEITGPQYFNNVALKVNVKLGGINVVPDRRDTQGILGDPINPTLIMGADAQHPAPGTEGRPSYTAVLGSVDPLASKYVATHRAQTSRREIIEDMEEMTKELIGRFQTWPGNQGKLPKRIIMYRDGVSEGQFAQVIELEIPKIKAAYKAFAFHEPPKLTFIVVGKRHHNRFFPENPTQADKSGNCQAGTVVDQGITHPVEYDWYLQSHAGLLGTSRPAHYSVLLDENDMQPDALQQLTYALCHVYARCTRSVSIPAPTYYADIVCERSANHYDPGVHYRFDDQSSSGTQRNFDAIANFKQANKDSYKYMYFT